MEVRTSWMPQTDPSESYPSAHAPKSGSTAPLYDQWYPFFGPRSTTSPVFASPRPHALGMTLCISGGCPAGNADVRRCYAPMISFSPSTTRAISSGVALPERLSMRPMASVRIWLIFAHDRFGRAFAFNSGVNGNSARCGWLVSATAITVPERSLNTS